MKNGSQVSVYLCALHLIKFQRDAGKPWADTHNKSIVHHLYSTVNLNMLGFPQ